MARCLLRVHNLRKPLFILSPRVFGARYWPRLVVRDDQQSGSASSISLSVPACQLLGRTSDIFGKD